MSELGDKIRAMKAPALNEHGHGWNTAIDQAAALADEHAATVAALDRIKREAHRAGMREAAGIAVECGADAAASAILAKIGEA